MDTPKRIYPTILGVILLFAFILMPSSIGGIFDGLPLGSKAEVLLVTCALGCLLWLNVGFLARPAARGTLFILFILKIFYVVCLPQGGILLRVYASKSDFIIGKTQKTYESLWVVLKRNYFIGGLWALNSSTNISYLEQKTLLSGLHNVTDLIWAFDSAWRPQHLQSFVSAVAFIVAGASLFMRRPLVPRSICIILMAALIPYFYVRTGGYVTRFATHLSPLSVICLGIIWRGLKPKAASHNQT